ncbi:dTDP-4-dehydrorhamnose 3,5-epimerase family protein [Taibaiella koreensis]|uniref:dTDP-4-dehydrorhamnose 3,5-epimerase family protein n=1 Tax=Taibaiella koreensis TaxID=1268548 RepID=UPI000E59AF80|nr:dTDP-4-dehydrorhamnose 3,5-epimerase family protein [Taibaiella koreensis]
MFHFSPLPLNDAFLVTLPAFNDDRGSFIKVFQHSIFAHEGIDFRLQESYFSLSAKDVIRGMHFQLPPHDHAKVVYCPSGAILDVMVDLRSDSDTYGRYYATTLSADNHLAYYIPKGFAHGFKSLSEGAMTCYLVSSEHSREHDTGIRYDSFGFDWECYAPVLSERDLSFSRLEDFSSPFLR